MAGEWIKVEIGLGDKPEVMRLARILKTDRLRIVGILFQFWVWTDKNTVDGVVDGVEVDDVDDVVTVPGFGIAMETVGWLKIDREQKKITLPKFERHNGESAKKRALKSERQARWRAKAPSTEPSTAASTRTSTRGSTREEKRRVTPIVPETFVKFWSAYPRKTAKPRALKAFEKLQFSNGAFQHLLDALEAAKGSEEWRREGGRFIPHPATWLNDRRFEDEPTQAPRAAWTP